MNIEQHYYALHTESCQHWTASNIHSILSLSSCLTLTLTLFALLMERIWIQPIEEKKPEMFHINMPSFRHCQLNITIPNKQNTATEQDSFVKKRRKKYIRRSEHNFYRRYFNIVYSYQRRNTRKRKKRFFGIFHRKKWFWAYQQNIKWKKIREIAHNMRFEEMKLYLVKYSRRLHEWFHTKELSTSEHKHNRRQEVGISSENDMTTYKWQNLNSTLLIQSVCVYVYMYNLQ